MKKCLASAIGLISCIPAASLAQGGAGPSMLEEVIVTARKREQSLQDVSVSVMALPDSLLQDAFLTDSEDLTQLVPSLNIQRGGTPNGSSFNIRGIGTQSFSAGVEPSVSTVVDGVVLGRSGMAFMKLLDVERVEVLRGPQGTLFGKNSSAGVLSIITQDPSEEFTATVSGTAIEDDQAYGGFTVSGPINDSLGYRVTGSYEWDDGYVDNVDNGDTLNSKDEYALRGKLRWDATDRLSLLFTSDYRDSDSTCCVPTLRVIDPWPEEPPNNQADVDEVLDVLSPVKPSDTNRKVNHDFPDEVDFTDAGYSLTADWTVGQHTLTSITARRKNKQTQSVDADFLPQQVFTASVNQYGDTKQEQWTQELRLTSPADNVVSYVAGLYYFDQTVNRNFSRFIGLGIPGLDGTATSIFQVDTLNYAAFGEATWNISEDWRLVLGARYTHDELDFDFERPSDSVAQPAIDPYSKDVTDDDTSGKATLEWNTTDDILLYATFVQGYKGPAFNITSGSTPDNTDAADPETSESFELGMKSSWLDNRLVLNVAVFHTEYDDFQAQATESRLILDDNGNPVDENGDGEDDRSFSFLLTNVGSVTTEGIEVDVMGQLTDKLSLFGGVAYIDAEMDDYPGGPCSFGQEFRGVGYRGQAGCGDDPATQDLSGGELPFSPDWKFNLAANYLIPLESQPFDLVLNASYRYQDDVQLSIDQDKYQRQDAYDVVDLSLKLEERTGRYSAALFVKNALDEDYVSAIGAQSENLIPNAYAQFFPRAYERRIGLELRYNWY
jgi:iron complex outermembrane receptor protein